MLGPTDLGILPANYLGLLAVLMPAFVIWLVWGEDPRMRWRYGSLQSGRGPTEYLLMLYLLGVPFGLFFLYVVYAAPFDMPVKPHLWGQHVVYLMLNTHLGLLVFGTIGALSTAALGAFLVFYLMLPLAAIKNIFFKEGQ
jgi:hypothetical protein